MMKAWVLHGINDMRFEDANVPALGENEARVRIMAAGICGSDIPRVFETGAHRHPLIIGHEFSGVVEGMGRSVDASWLGKRVGVFPLIPCGKCMPCLRGQYEMCRGYDYLGSRSDGGFAEYAAAPVENLIELPGNVSFEAGAMLEPMAVAVHAMRRARPYKNDTVVISGLGTIGLLLTMFLREAGMEKIFVIGNRDFQMRQARELGVTDGDFCDVRRQDAVEWVMGRTDAGGADVVFECAGKNSSVSAAIGCAAPGGRVILVGNPASDMAFDRETYWKILRNQLMVKGSWNSSFTHGEEDDWHYVSERLSDGRVCPERLITHRLKLQELEQGLHIMRDRTEDCGKVMLLLT